MTCTCAIYGWGRVDNPTCPIHNRPRSLRRLLRVMRPEDDLGRDATGNCRLCGESVTHAGVGCSWGCPANFVHGCAPPGKKRVKVTQEKIEQDEIESHEQLLLALLREHRASCRLCHDREDLWVTCALGEVLRGAWFNAFRLLIQPTRWSSVETVRPFQIGGVS